MNQTPEHISSIYSSPWTTSDYWMVGTSEVQEASGLMSSLVSQRGWDGYISKMSVTGMIPNPYDEPIGANHNQRIIIGAIS